MLQPQASSDHFLYDIEPMNRKHVTDGWLKDPNQAWTVRFHKELLTEGNDVRVVVDHGKRDSDTQNALLKSRRNMRYEDAVSLYKELQLNGWQHCEAAW